MSIRARSSSSVASTMASGLFSSAVMAPRTPRTAIIGAPIPPGWPRASAHHLHEVGRDVFDEARRLVVERVAVEGALLGTYEVEQLARARDAHIGQAALLFHLSRILERAAVREDAFFQAGDEDDREL